MSSLARAPSVNAQRAAAPPATDCIGPRASGTFSSNGRRARRTRASRQAKRIMMCGVGRPHRDAIDLATHDATRRPARRRGRGPVRHARKRRAAYHHRATAHRPRRSAARARSGRRHRAARPARAGDGTSFVSPAVRRENMIRGAGRGGGAVPSAHVAAGLAAGRPPRHAHQRMSRRPRRPSRHALIAATCADGTDLPPHPLARRVKTARVVTGREHLLQRVAHHRHGEHAPVGRHEARAALGGGVARADRGVEVEVEQHLGGAPARSGRNDGRASRKEARSRAQCIA